MTALYRVEDFTKAQVKRLEKAQQLFQDRTKDALEFLGTLDNLVASNAFVKGYERYIDRINQHVARLLTSKRTSIQTQVTGAVSIWRDERDAVCDCIRDAKRVVRRNKYTKQRDIRDLVKDAYDVSWARDTVKMWQDFCW